MTQFSLVRHAWEYRQCHQLLRRLNRHVLPEVSDPIIKATRDDIFVGFVSTAPLEKGVVMLSELAIIPEIKHPAHLMWRLVEVYDAFLVSKGIKEWLAPIPLVYDDYIEMITKLVGPPYRSDEHYAWFKRSTS